MKVNSVVFVFHGVFENGVERDFLFAAAVAAAAAAAVRQWLEWWGLAGSLVDLDGEAHQRLSRFHGFGSSSFLGFFSWL